MYFSLENWIFYENYLTASLKCQSLTECLEFFEEIAAKSGNKSRAPHLARLELLKRAQETEIECPPGPVGVMHKYFNQFGSKGCVVSDMKIYLHLLSPSEKCILLEKVNMIGNTCDSYRIRSRIRTNSNC